MNLLQKVKNRLYLISESHKFAVARIKAIQLLTQSSPGLIRSYKAEIEKDHPFLDSLREKLRENFTYTPSRDDVLINEYLK